MLRRLLPLAIVASAHAAVPERYDMTMSLATVPVSGGQSFGAKFLFTTGNQVIYRLVPAGGSESSPATSLRFWSPSAGAREILPANGYTSLEIAGLTPSGIAFGRSRTPEVAESALVWTLAGGSLAPGGFDPGFSALTAMSATGAAAGFTDSGTFLHVAWNARQPADVPVPISAPAGYTVQQTLGVSGAGEVLLYVTDGVGGFRIAVWDGSSSQIAGPEPTGTLWPSNCAINTRGDIALLEFTAGGAAKLSYISAANRTTWQEFLFAGPIDSSVYNLRVSDAALASFDTSISGVNTVAIASASRAQQRTFTGYRSYLNHPGVLIFGNQGHLLYWDAAAWAGAPAVVPVSATSNSGGIDFEGFNDDGRLLVLLTQGASRSLGILSPAFAVPASVTLRPERKRVRLRAGARVRMRLVETRVVGNTLDGAIRYEVKGRLPVRMRFRHSEGILSGVPQKPGRTTLRVTANYRSGGVKKQSPPVRIKVVIRPR